MTDKNKFDLEKYHAINRLQNLLVRLEKIEYLDKTPMLFKVFEITLAVDTIEETLNSFIKFKKVLPIRKKRINELKKIKEEWLKQLEKEGKTEYDNDVKHPYTMDVFCHAYSWEE